MLVTTPICLSTWASPPHTSRKASCRSAMCSAASEQQHSRPLSLGLLTASSFLTSSNAQPGFCSFAHGLLLPLTYFISLKYCLLSASSQSDLEKQVTDAWCFPLSSVLFSSVPHPSMYLGDPVSLPFNLSSTSTYQYFIQNIIQTQALLTPNSNSI